VITGAHSIIYTSDPDGVRAFFRDVLELPSVDAGHGWLIFALPPAEVAAHPTDEPGTRESSDPTDEPGTRESAHPTDEPGRRESADPAERAGRHALYLMCDDIHATVDELRDKGVEFIRPIAEERWGLVTAIGLPGGAELGLYEPRHPTPPR
jgi:catechol 2,3-dioxygenase-like lactoylglutathione lyase family enzyme